MEISLATPNDITTIITLIQARIEWMDRMNINQWNKSDYLKTFTLDYFAQVIENKNLYKVKSQNQTTIGAFTLFNQDERWTDNLPALYIHNLVSKVESANVGDNILLFCEEKASEQGISRLRIDCQRDNIKLNDYYEKRDFIYINSFQEELYSGNRREKIIK